MDALLKFISKIEVKSINLLPQKKKEKKMGISHKFWDP